MNDDDLPSHIKRSALKTRKPNAITAERENHLEPLAVDSVLH